MDDFYAARSSSMPPLPWPSFSPPFSFVTNDTDWLGSSDIDDVITNEFGVNFQVSEQLATRMSYTTEYQENREIRTDNRLGVAVVYGF